VDLLFRQKGIDSGSIPQHGEKHKIIPNWSAGGVFGKLHLHRRHLAWWKMVISTKKRAKNRRNWVIGLDNEKLLM
jgi:transposase